MSPRHHQGITLIEVLIAIIVFGVGILAIVSTLTTNILLSERVRLKTTATMLAHEGMDIFYNLKDTNLDKWMNRDCAKIVWDVSIWLSCGEKLLDASSVRQYRTAALDPSQTYTLSRIANTGDDTLLYTHTDGTFTSMTHVLSPTLTPFRRYILVQPVTLASDPQSPQRDLLKIESHVAYTKGSIRGDVVLESFIGKTRK